MKVKCITCGEVYEKTELNLREVFTCKCGEELVVNFACGAPLMLCRTKSELYDSMNNNPYNDLIRKLDRNGIDFFNLENL